MSQTSGIGDLGKAICSPAVVLALSFLTLGIYFLVWYYKINDEIRRHDPSIPGQARLGGDRCGVLLIFNLVRAATAPPPASARCSFDEGAATQTISPVVALVLHIRLLGIGYPLYVASQLREHWHGHRRAAAVV